MTATTTTQHQQEEPMTTTATNIIAPAALNERFTVWLNTDGKPVQKALREMTGGEVLMAGEWLEEECERLAAASDKLRDLIAPLHERNARDPEAVFSKAELATMQAAITSGDETIAALEKANRLTQAIVAAMPQWREPTNMTLSQALKRYWPKPRNAA
jgi:hypothetical protein